jgi:mRNA-degrading endonuclease RelE of RelBE toxin-antitoxin system
MKIFQTDTFSKQLKKLPVAVRKLYQQQENLFTVDWKDSRLHTKKLQGGASVFSFRITSRYRVLFIFIDKETTLFTSIGHRKDIYE